MLAPAAVQAVLAKRRRDRRDLGGDRPRRFTVRVDVDRVRRAMELARKARLAVEHPRNPGVSTGALLEDVGGADLDATPASSAPLIKDHRDHGVTSGA
jgi:hypothetical protein